MRHRLEDRPKFINNGVIRSIAAINCSLRVIAKPTEPIGCGIPVIAGVANGVALGRAIEIIRD
jgi:hypothetical protein